MDRSLIEPVPVQDIFVSGVGAIEAVGSESLRFWLYVLQPITPGEPQEKVVVAKIMIARATVPDYIIKALHLAGVPAH